MVLHKHTFHILGKISLIATQMLAFFLLSFTLLCHPLKFPATEQDVHLPRQRIWVAWRLQLKAALTVPKRSPDDQHSTPWRQHQQLPWTVYPLIIVFDFYLWWWWLQIKKINKLWWIIIHLWLLFLFSVLSLTEPHRHPMLHCQASPHCATTV